MAVKGQYLLWSQSVHAVYPAVATFVPARHLSGRVDPATQIKPASPQSCTAESKQYFVAGQLLQSPEAEEEAPVLVRPSPQ